MGRKRTVALHLPPGVREKGGRWYWQPTSKRERDERRAQGLPCTVPLGLAGEAARRKWAEVSGYRDASPTAPGTVQEVLDHFEQTGLARKANGLPRSAKTVADYRLMLKALGRRFGSCRYGKTEFEASRGQALGVVDIQRFVAESEHKAAANRATSVLSAAFAHAIREGLTTYNPCRGVARKAEAPRTRTPEPWEVEVLCALAGPLLALLIAFERVTGWRVSDMLKLKRQELTAAGIRLVQGKRGRRQLWEWTPELRRIVSEAARLPGADRSMFVFPSARGTPLTLSGFETMWQRLKANANALLAKEMIVLAIHDLHFHDLRSMAGDDAADEGRNIAEFLGNDPSTASRHYRRRETKVRPLK